MAGSGDPAPGEASSVGYSERLTQGHYRGNLNLQHVPDGPLAVVRKTRILAERIRAARAVVLHTGAGLSTAAGVSDFRGPNGIWTKEKQREEKIAAEKRAQQEAAAALKRSRAESAAAAQRSVRQRTAAGAATSPRPGMRTRGSTGIRTAAPKEPPPSENSAPDDPAMQVHLPPPVAVEEAVPTLAHMVIAAMVRTGLVDHIVSQNVDGLHLRSGVPRDKLSELHGNLFMEWCRECAQEFPRDYELQTAGMKWTGNFCPTCTGELCDKTLDWDSELPEPDCKLAFQKAKAADLNIVVGSSCQMTPSMHLPFRSGNRNSSVIINLSETEKDSDAGFIIRATCDTVFALLAHELDITVPPFQQRATLMLDVTPVKKPVGTQQRISMVMHSSLGGLWMRIPYVRGVHFEVAGAAVAPQENMPHYRAVTTVDRKDWAGVLVRAVVALRNGEVVTLQVVFDGEHGTGRRETIVREHDYREELVTTMRKIRVAATGDGNKRQMERDFMSWFVRAERPRYVICSLCREEVFSSGMSWQGRVQSHIRNCLHKAIAEEKRKEQGGARP